MEPAVVVGLGPYIHALKSALRSHKTTEHEQPDDLVLVEYDRSTASRIRGLSREEGIYHLN
jgi:hypothetical protein